MVESKLFPLFHLFLISKGKKKKPKQNNNSLTHKNQMNRMYNKYIFK